MFDLKVIAKEFYDNTVGQWLPLPEAILIDGSYFFRNRDGVHHDSLDAFAKATGWDLSEEQFLDESWQPASVQVYVEAKAKPDGKGMWYTFAGIASFDAEKCGPPPRVSSSFGSTLQKHKATKGAAPAAPGAPVKRVPF